jgi:hypothetical protein
VAALLTALLLLGQIRQSQAASTSETLLFESIGETVVGLSYSHTVLSIPLTELERQVQDYKQALLRDFNEDAIDSKITYQVITQSDMLGIKHIEAVRENWLQIGAIHLEEVERIEKRVARLFEILSPSKTSSPDDRTVFNFKEPTDPNADAEWIDISDRLQKKETQLRKGKRPKRALPLLMAGAALMFGGAGTLFGWLGIRGSQRVGTNYRRLRQCKVLSTRSRRNMLK